MKNGTAIWNGQHAVDRTLAAMQEMERYCAAHPQSPAAMRRPWFQARSLKSNDNFFPALTHAGDRCHRSNDIQAASAATF
jgi:hypothetical protein